MSAGSADAGFSAALRTVSRRVGWELGRIELLVRRLPTPKPWQVFGVLVVANWCVLLGVGLAAAHNTTLYYSGGDASWYYTTAWALGHGHIPDGSIGFGYPLFLIPATWLGGGNMLAGMPYVIVCNAIVLAPIALACVYGIARLIAGRAYATAVATLWVLIPILAIPDFYARYHERYVSLTLPAVLGLTPLGDYPSMVCLLVVAYFLLRSFVSGQRADILVAGLTTGLALLVKPANAEFIAAPVLALLVARRWRDLPVFVAGIAPALLALAIWKYRGIGYLPLFERGSRYALGVHPTIAALGLLHSRNYLSFNWDRLSSNIDGLREFTWSRRLLEWFLVAGAIGLFRRSAAAATLVVSWLLLYVFLKGGTVADFDGGTFFRYLAPAFPAAFLLTVSTPLLIPVHGPALARLGRRSGTFTRRSAPLAKWLCAGFAVAVVLLLVLPTAGGNVAVRLDDFNLYVPINQFSVTATRAAGGKVELSWPAQDAHGARVVYGIDAAASDPVSCRGIEHAAAHCTVYEPLVATTTTPGWTGTLPGKTSVVRVSVMATPMGGASTTDTIMFSRAVTVR